jgi:PAS domain S-box-containing protein
VLTFVGLLSTDGRLVEVNAGALHAAGLDAAEVLGRPLWETPWWSASDEARHRLREAVDEVARGASVRYDVELQIADDERIMVDFQLVPLRDSTGAISRLVPTASTSAIGDARRTCSTS